MTEREVLKSIGYDEQTLSNMSDEDCEHELIEIKTGGHQ